MPRLVAGIDEQLAWEAKQRPRAGIASILAGVGLLAGNIIQVSVYGNVPTQPLLDSLALAQRGQETTITVQQVLYFDTKFGLSVLNGLILAVAGLCLAVALQMLLRAATFRRAVPAEGERRRQDFLGLGRILALGGPVIFALANLVFYEFLAFKSSSFADKAQKTEEAAKDVLESDIFVAAATTPQIASLLIGFAFVILCLAAMRAGLLTRFMGVLGIFVGVLFVIPIGSPVPIVPAFWLVALGVLLLGRWPQGMPPAWTSGKAEPWPSRQALIEQARAERDARGGGGGRGKAPSDEEARPAPAAAAAEADEDRGPLPASKRKKRKRR